VEVLEVKHEGVSFLFLETYCRKPDGRYNDGRRLSNPDGVCKEEWDGKEK